MIVAKKDGVKDRKNNNDDDMIMLNIIMFAESFCWVFCCNVRNPLCQVFMILLWYSYNASHSCDDNVIIIWKVIVIVKWQW